ncbi:MAG: response regulator [Myxococcales bacterium]|nr:response regulator [Myxococcales bacterium]
MRADLPGDGAEAGEGLGEVLVPGLIHELRHPLTGMKAGLQLLAQALGPGATKGEEWALVTAQLARLEELFQSYEEFLRPEQAAQGSFLLAGVVDHAVGLLRHRTRPFGDAFTCQVPASPVTVSGTPRAVTHALTNLLVNALDAVEEAGGRRRVEVRLVQPMGTDSVELRVSDEGTGIKPEVAERLFAARVTSKAPGKGSGLGLWIARRMLAACEGSVALVPAGDAQRAPWAATEFCITLRKAATGPVFSSPTPAPQPAPSPTPAAAEPLDVLVVDDEPTITSLLQSLLFRLGHRVTTTTSSARAAELLTAGKFDLLITDKNMPGLTGVDLARAARERHPRILVMLITAFASKESASELRKLGVDDYLKKPFELDDLAARLRELQARSKALSKAAAAPAPGADGAVRLAAVAVEQKVFEQLRAAMGLLEGTAVAVPDVSAALALVPQVDLVVVAAQHLTREAKLAVWKVRVERPGFGVVLLSDGGLEDELVGISVGTRFLLGTGLELPQAEAVLRAALGR